MEHLLSLAAIARGTSGCTAPAGDAEPGVAAEGVAATAPKSATSYTDPARVVVAGPGTVYATHPPTGDLWAYTGGSPAWTRIGGPGAQFVANETTLYGVSPADSSVWQYDGTPLSWTQIGHAVAKLFAGGQALYATDPITGNVSRYDGTPFSWTQVGSPGSEFVANANGLYGLSPDRSGVWQLAGGWTQVGGPATDIFAGGAGLFATSPATGDIWRYDGTPMSWTQTGSPGSEFVVNDVGLYGLSPDRSGVWQYANGWTQVGGAAQAIFADAHGLYSTSPANGNVWRYSGTPMKWNDLGVPCPASDPGYLDITSFAVRAVIGEPLEATFDVVSGETDTASKTFTVLLDGKPTALKAVLTAGQPLSTGVTGPIVTASTTTTHTLSWTTSCGTVTRTTAAPNLQPTPPSIQLTASPTQVNAGGGTTLTARIWEPVASDCTAWTGRLVGVTEATHTTVLDQAIPANDPYVQVSQLPMATTDYSLTVTCTQFPTVTATSTARVVVAAPAPDAGSQCYPLFPGASAVAFDNTSSVDTLAIWQNDSVTGFSFAIEVPPGEVKQVPLGACHGVTFTAYSESCADALGLDATTDGPQLPWDCIKGTVPKPTIGRPGAPPIEAVF